MSVYSSVKCILSVNRSLQGRLCLFHLLQTQCGLSSVQQRPICLSHGQYSVVSPGFMATQASYYRRALNKIKYFLILGPQMNAKGYFLYETVADKLPYLDFFKVMNLPDTFNSWFLVTELHVWMLMVKAMEYGEDGRKIRNFIVKAMWEDVVTKSKKLGSENISKTQKQVHVLGDQFQAALLTYDEGLLSDDKVLASALWRRFFERDCSDPESLEMMVKYVRRQMQYLDSILEEDFKAYKITWLPLEKT